MRTLFDDLIHAIEYEKHQAELLLQREWPVSENWCPVRTEKECKLTGHHYDIDFENTTMVCRECGDTQPAPKYKHFRWSNNEDCKFVNRKNGVSKQRHSEVKVSA